MEEAGKSRHTPSALSRLPHSTAVCLEVAEAWVVSVAAALIHTRASLEARFLQAQAHAGTARGILGLGEGRLGEAGSGSGVVGSEGAGAARGAEGAGAARGGEESVGAEERGPFLVQQVPFSVAPTVCEAPKAESFGKQRFLRQFIVDGERGGLVVWIALLLGCNCSVAPCNSGAPKAESFGKQRFLRQFIVDGEEEGCNCSASPCNSGPLKAVSFKMQQFIVGDESRLHGVEDLFPRAAAAGQRILCDCLYRPLPLPHLQPPEDLKTIYCFVPKVACTGWKTWFREQQGQANVSDVFLTHDKARSGLRILAYHFPEHRAIELLTRPDFFKFSFVRNPYTRLASVYLNKHVVLCAVPPFHSSVHPDRFHPAHSSPLCFRPPSPQMFFRKFIPFRRLVKAKKGNDLFTFGEFAWLLRLMREQRRGRMESHVQPQIDACRFDKIRFDFIGRFENLAKDVGVVLRRLNRNVGESGAFKISKDAHPTNAGSKLLELYDEVSGVCEDVGVVLRRPNRTVGESGAFEISKDKHPNAGSRLLELYAAVQIDAHPTNAGSRLSELHAAVQMDARPTNAGSKLLERYDEISKDDHPINAGGKLLERYDEMSRDARPTNAGSKLLERYDEDVHPTSAGSKLLELYDEVGLHGGAAEVGLHGGAAEAGLHGGAAEAGLHGGAAEVGLHGGAHLRSPRIRAADSCWEHHLPVQG
ncbi:unnamed protein product [Closterium sp. Yama58-4]|nr:unnamed protein product [Closterium sp. Yama58-4]